MIYVTSDLHLGHINICGEDGFVKTRTHFADAQEMNDFLIKQIRKTVEPKDTLIHLGDLSLNMKPKEIFDLVTQIPCQIILVKGNHDSSKEIKHLMNNNFLMKDGRMKFIFHEVGFIHKQDGKSYYMSHFPIGLGGLRGKLRSICGHIHEEVANEPNVINVGIDSPELPEGHEFGVPLKLSTAIELVEKKFADSQEYKIGGIY